MGKGQGPGLYRWWRNAMLGGRGNGGKAPATHSRAGIIDVRELLSTYQAFARLFMLGKHIVGNT